MTPAPEKAAPIRAEVREQTRKLAEFVQSCMADLSVDEDGEIVGTGPVSFAIARAIMQDRADRASQEDRIEAFALHPKESYTHAEVEGLLHELSIRFRRANLEHLLRALTDRASQEERIREDEPLPERLRKSYEKGAQDERDRLYKAGLKWPRDVCDFLEIEGAKVRARQRGDAS